MTSEELNKLEEQIRAEKSKGHSSNVVLKISQVERLIAAARAGQPTAEVYHFNIAAEARRDEIEQRRYQERWANHRRKLRLEKQEKERQLRKNQRRQELIDKWKNYGGSQKQLSQN